MTLRPVDPRPLLCLAPLLLMPVVACGGDDDDGAGEDMGSADLATDAALDMAPECGPEVIPAGRSEVVAAFDAARQRIVVFGGNLGGAPTPPSCTPPTNATDEVLVYDLVCERWSTLDTTGGGPGPLGRAVGALDVARNRLIVYGGRNQARVNQDTTWALDLETLEWTQLGNPGVRPPARINSTMVYDAPRDRMVLFGGNLGNPLAEDPDQRTWAFDLAAGSWAELPFAGSPPASRYYHSAAIRGDTMYVFGGQVDFINYLNDVYAFDLTMDRWTRVRGGGDDAPPTRFGATLAAASGRLVLVAGHDATALGNMNDLWSLDLGTSDWTAHATGDVIDAGGTGMACDLPADFATADASLPERRHAHAMVDDGSTAYIIFGKTDCGDTTDLWTVDLASPAYAPLGDATVGGEACARTGRTDCTQYCD